MSIFPELPVLSASFPLICHLSVLSVLNFISALPSLSITKSPVPLCNISELPFAVCSLFIIKPPVVFVVSAIRLIAESFVEPGAFTSKAASPEAGATSSLPFISVPVVLNNAVFTELLDTPIWLDALL